jgi:hypothetical protein
MLHLSLHLIVPLMVAVFFFRSQWGLALCWMLATMLVDLDHLLADPIYNPGRCSIGFHPLHEPIIFLVYFALCAFPKTRFVGLGLVIHMVLDSIDCQVTNGVWFV